MVWDHANTRVFWDLDDFPIPGDGRDLSKFSWNVEKALKNEAFQGNVSIYAYGGGKTDEEAGDIVSARNLMFFRDDDKDARLNSMFIDMIYWACGHRPSQDNHGQHTNLMVIAKDVPQKDSSFFKVLNKELDELSYNILLVIPDEEGLQLPTNENYTAEELLSIPILVWRWKTLFVGGPHICEEKVSSQGHNTVSECQEGNSQGVKTDADSEN